MKKGRFKRKKNDATAETGILERNIIISDKKTSFLDHKCSLSWPYFFADYDRLRRIAGRVVQIAGRVVRIAVLDSSTQL